MSNAEPIEFLLKQLRLTPEVKASLKKGDEWAQFKCVTEGHVFADTYPTNKGRMCRRCAMLETELLTDDGLVEVLVKWERGWLKAYERFKHHPMALSSPTPLQKRRFDILFDEAERRGLMGRVRGALEDRPAPQKKADPSNIVLEIRAAVKRGEEDRGLRERVEKRCEGEYDR